MTPRFDRSRSTLEVIENHGFVRAMLVVLNVQRWWLTFMQLVDGRETVAARLQDVQVRACISVVYDGSGRSGPIWPDSIWPRKI